MFAKIMVALQFYFTLVRAYVRGMTAYDKLNPPSISNQFTAFTDEFKELVEALWNCDWCEAYGEFWDVVHSGCRLIVITLNTIFMIDPELFPVLQFLPLIGWPTARKHAERWLRYRCIRSFGHHHNGVGKGHKCDFVTIID